MDSFSRIIYTILLDHSPNKQPNKLVLYRKDLGLKSISINLLFGKRSQDLGFIHLRIYHATLLDEDECELRLFEDCAGCVINPEMISSRIQQLSDTLNNLVYCKISNTFTTKDKVDKLKELTQASHEVFGEELFEDTCSVCMDYTSTRSNCNHFLCLECFEKIENSRCPLCRSLIDRRNGFVIEKEYSTLY